MNLKVNGLNVLNSQKPKINNAFIAFKAQPDEFIKNNSDIENREFIDRKIEELKNNAELIQKKSICIDKKSCDAEFLIGTQEGSNPGAYVVLKRNNDPDNNLYYAKFSNGLFERTKAEVLASKIYKLADINAADMKKFISYSDKKSGLISKYIPNQTSVFSSNKLVNKGFAMDAFLANWDAVCSNNVLTDGKKATRIDFGGCFDYRAQGKIKPFGSIVEEISTLIDPKINYQSAYIFSTLDRKDLINSLEKVVNINDEDLINLLNEEKMLYYKDTLLKRKEYLKDFLQIANEIPQDDLSILDYIKKVKTETYFPTIEKASNLEQINEIQNSINNNIDDINIKQELQTKLDNKKEYLLKIQPSLNESIDRQTLINLLKDNGLRFENESIPFVKNFFTPHSIKKLKPINNDDVINMVKLINVCNGEYIDTFKKDIVDFYKFYRLLCQNTKIYKSSFLFHKFYDLTDEQWDAIVNLFSAKPNLNQQTALSNYKCYNYDKINQALSDMLNEGTMPEKEIMKDITSIDSFLRTQKTHKKFKVYRGEGYEVLNSINIEGQKLSELMKDAANSKDENKINALIDKVESHNFSAVQERFMSTAMLKDSAFTSEDILWELDVPEGTYGAFIDVFDNSNRLSETEFLVKRNSKITITGLDFDKENSKWIIKGKIQN